MLPFTPGGQYLVAPYVPGMVRSATRIALARSGYAPNYIALNPTDPFAYARLVVHLWSTRATVVIVEHDIVPPDGSIGALFDCPRPWCIHPYLISGRRYLLGLGLVKLAGTMMGQHPDLARRAVCRKREGVIDTEWRSVDRYLARALQGRNRPPHFHQPDAVHLHEYDERG